MQQAITNEQIENFLNGSSTPEEAEAVCAYLEQHPNHPYLVREWNDTDGNTPLEKNLSGAMLAAIQKQTQTGAAVFRFSKAVRIAAAACVMGLIGLVAFFALQNKTARPVQAAAATPRWIIKANTTAVNLQVTLPDASVITLYPGSLIRYTDSFMLNGKRDVYLEGASLFRVAKDKGRPFSVMAGHTVTTALGTVFLVQMQPSQHVQVKLYEGRVKIVSTHDDGAKRVYLSPGEMYTSGAGGFSRLTAFASKDSLPHRAPPGAARAKSAQASELSFNREKLNRVFDKLHAVYNCRIIYNAQDLSKARFTGRFKNTDSLNFILNVICNMNGLAYTNMPGKEIVISKPD